MKPSVLESSNMLLIQQGSVQVVVTGLDVRVMTSDRVTPVAEACIVPGTDTKCIGKFIKTSHVHSKTRCRV